MTEQKMQEMESTLNIAKKIKEDIEKLELVVAVLENGNCGHKLVLHWFDKIETLPNAIDNGLYTLLKNEIERLKKELAEL